MKLNIFDHDIYYQVYNSDQDKTILFIHGNSHDHRSFSLQADSPRFKDYRIVSLDLPGHGASEPHEKYGPISLAKTVHQFISFLGLENAALVGHSLGGHVIMHLLNSFVPKAIFIYGSPPLRKPLDMSGFKDCPEAQAIFKEEVTNQEKDELMFCLYQDPKCDPYISESFDQTDPKFRSQILENLTRGDYYDESKLLESYDGPKALVTAQKDKIIDHAYVETSVETQKLWNQKVLQLSGAHNLHRDVPEEFNDILLQFLDQVHFT